MMVRFIDIGPGVLLGWIVGHTHVALAVFLVHIRLNFEIVVSEGQELIFYFS